MSALHKRRILVTGCNRGIGLATTQSLIEQGMQVIGLGLQEESTLKESDDFTYIACDLNNLKQLTSTFKNIISTYPDLDAVIANAGIGSFGHLEQTSDEEILHTVNINLTSQILLAKAFTPHLKTLGRGDFIFVGSVAGIHPGKKGSLYCATKAGLHALSKALREECSSKNVRVMLVQPGMTRTNFYDQLHFEPGDAIEHALEPLDVAHLIVTLLAMPKHVVIDEVTATPLKKVIQFKS
jgi:NADP-dependent 3-hydroxy acid dehydrogenase YdfG